MHSIEQLAVIAERLASTQRNLPLFKTEEEHEALHEIARLLRKMKTTIAGK